MKLLSDRAGTGWRAHAGAVAGAVVLVAALARCGGSVKQDGGTPSNTGEAGAPRDAAVISPADAHRGDACASVTLTSHDNCGACGHACRADEACVQGACTISCDGGSPCDHVVFVTHYAFDGMFAHNGPGIDGTDQACQSAAALVGVAGTFKAWTSIKGTSSPSSRFTHSTAPYRLLDGTMVARDWIGLTSGTLLAPINLTEFKATLMQGELVWTGTRPNGTYDDSYTGDQFGNDCTYFSTNGPYVGTAGSSAATDKTWTKASSEFCDEKLHLYCFQQ